MSSLYYTLCFTVAAFHWVKKKFFSLLLQQIRHVILALTQHYVYHKNFGDKSIIF